MPKLLDVVIGLTVVMLVVSLAVTLLTQFLTSVINTQGRVLKWGLANLIVQIDSRFARASAAPKKGALADEIADAILTHPMIGERFLGKQRPGSVVHRSELTRLLIEFAIAPMPATTIAAPLKPTTQAVLQEVLSDLGIPDPAATLKEIRMSELVLEQSHPELANGLRRDFAILEKAATQFVAKINAWFDQTIDRVSSVFTAHARIITFSCAVVVAVALQLDTVAIVNGLWTNDDLRKEIVDEGISFAKAHPPMPRAIPGDQSSKPADAQKAGNTKPQSMSETQIDQLAHDQAVRYLDVLSQYGIVAFPALNSRQWWNHWSASELPGIILSALLLSMGAPFWYSTLQTLLRLRSQIAQSDDQQRNFRKNNEGSTLVASSPAQPPS
jgi:hypothetical protein